MHIQFILKNEEVLHWLTRNKVQEQIEYRNAFTHDKKDVVGGEDVHPVVPRRGDYVKVPPVPMAGIRVPARVVKIVWESSELVKIYLEEDE